MKASKLRSLWITVAASFFTGYYCFLASVRGFCGKAHRGWVDKTIRTWSSRLLKLARVNYVVVNPHHVEPKLGQPTIIMSNHSSLYDIPVSFKTFPNHSIRWLAKKELSQVPFMGRGMVAAECPFIDRKNRHQAIKDLNAAKRLLESGIIMWIAAEGTRSKDGRLADFKKGPFITAIEAKATIILIGIRGAFNIIPAKTRHFNINEQVEIHVGKPIDASLYTLENKEELIKKAHQEMKALLES
ncbi:MAG: glycerol acyltransferase [Legionellales bacterium RIFCSPHIGHO2_12_FULL_42_9]|nr:MAG: glycerol acyltransferase [Legionellales bacterium RIFCSPHIGHO2_12_FULL_42_9]